MSLNWTTVTTYPLGYRDVVVRLERSSNGTYRAVLVGYYIVGEGSVGSIALHDLVDTLELLVERLKKEIE